jgi:uncharacterized repeat protein (TIGR03943 family)
VTAAGGTITLLVGAVLLRLTVSGTYRRYVREEMEPWLAVAGVAIVLLGIVTLVQALRRDRTWDAHGHGERGDRAGWLLLAPIAALLLVAPPTLGSYGVARSAAIDVRAGAPVFRPLTPGPDGPIRMTLLEFSQRAIERNGASFADASVRLTGFVAAVEDGGFRLARYRIGCCAADALPVVVRVLGGTTTQPVDRWVTVTGRFEPDGGSLPALAATDVTPIAAPAEPYE